MSLTKKETDLRHYVKVKAKREACLALMISDWIRAGNLPIWVAGFMVRKSREAGFQKARARRHYLQNRKDFIRRVTEWNRGYRKGRYAQDPSYRIICNLRSRLTSALSGTAKAASTIALLGCSVEDLRRHLERKFKPGMTWGNHGSKWHIDHARPCASFDLACPEQQKECFNFKNLQPLWKLDNLKKGAR